jgi:hypothetical protein
MTKEIMEKIHEAEKLLEEAQKGVESVSGFRLRWNVEIGYDTTTDRLIERYARENSANAQ